MPIDLSAVPAMGDNEKRVPEGFRYFEKSKYRSKCRKCLHRIPEGTPLVWDKSAPMGKRCVCWSCFDKGDDIRTWTEEQRRREIRMERERLPDEVREILKNVDTSDMKAVEEAQKAIDRFYAEREGAKYEKISRITATPRGMGKGQFAAVIRFDRDIDYEDITDALKSIVDVCEDIKIGEFDPSVGVPVFYVP